MSVQCETIVKYILPVFRSYVAKELVDKHNFTQVEVARRIGTTQAAISQYLHSKRGYNRFNQSPEILNTIKSAAFQTAEKIAADKIHSKGSKVDFCQICNSINIINIK